MWNRGNLLAPYKLAAKRPTGLTLVEMLVAMALSLIMFAAVAQIFGMMGNAVHESRSTIELSGNLRSVTNHLYHDLDNITSDVLPWVHVGKNQGYFEIIEGPDRDSDYAVFDVIDPVSTTDPFEGSVSGDADDIICFTAYSKDEPFVGLIQGELESFDTDGDGVSEYPASPYKYWIDRTTNPGTFTAITSQYAEIIYWTRHTEADDINLESWQIEDYRDPNETVTLYRRVRLIRPDIFVGNPATSIVNSYPLTYSEAMNYYDLSMSSTTTTGWQCNSLEQLQERQYRVGHFRVPSPTGFPHPIRAHQLYSFEELDINITGSAAAPNLRDRTGEDVILNRVLAFDVRVYDPFAIVKQETSGDGLNVQPSDPGYGYTGGCMESVTVANMMTGAFVDLNWGAEGRATQPSFSGNPVPHFGAGPASKSGLSSFAVNDSTHLFPSAPANITELKALYPLNPSRLVSSTDYLADPTNPPDVTMTYAYYDTWPYFYETDAANQDGDGLTNEGTDGFDNNSNGLVDEEDELETSPPYQIPLRGISIQVRAYEEGMRQVRQDTVVVDFLPK